MNNPLTLVYLIFLLHTWYLQQGSNCHEAVYTPVQKTDSVPKGTHAIAESRHNNPGN